MLHCNADFVIETTLSVLVLLIFDKSVFGFLQNGLATKVEKSRKQMKERKNRAKKIRGVKKVMHTCTHLTVVSNISAFGMWGFHCISVVLIKIVIFCVFFCWIGFADKGWGRQEEMSKVSVYFSRLEFE
jgi:hypothetical protein